MKVKKILKKKQRNTTTSETKVASPLSGVNKSWMTTGVQQMNKNIARREQQMQKQRVPRFWMRDGEAKTIRFRWSEPLCQIMQYTLPVGGNRFQSYTSPGINPATGEHDPDLFAQSGHKPSAKHLFEIIDRTGYKTREGKSVTDVPRIWEAGTRVFQQIMTIANNVDDFTGIDFMVQRSGSGTSTTYTLVPGKPSPLNLSKIPSIADDVPKWYAPPTLEEQNEFLSKYVAMDNGDMD